MPTFPPMPNPTTTSQHTHRHLHPHAHIHTHTHTRARIHMRTHRHPMVSEGFLNGYSHGFCMGTPTVSEWAWAKSGPGRRPGRPGLGTKVVLVARRAWAIRSDSEAFLVESGATITHTHTYIHILERCLSLYSDRHGVDLIAGWI